MNVTGLVDLTNDGAGDPDIYRDLDASARALRTTGDPDPLLRLYAERTAFQENYFGVSASVYSGELYQAVSCLDYPQLFDMHAKLGRPIDRTGAGDRGSPRVDVCSIHD